MKAAEPRRLFRPEAPHEGRREALLREVLLRRRPNVRRHELAHGPLGGLVVLLRVPDPLGRLLRLLLLVVGVHPNDLVVLLHLLLGAHVAVDQTLHRRVHLLPRHRQGNQLHRLDAVGRQLLGQQRDLLLERHHLRPVLGRRRRSQRRRRHRQRRTRQRPLSLVLGELFSFRSFRRLLAPLLLLLLLFGPLVGLLLELGAGARGAEDQVPEVVVALGEVGFGLGIEGPEDAGVVQFLEAVQELGDLADDRPESRQGSPHVGLHPGPDGHVREVVLEGVVVVVVAEGVTPQGAAGAAAARPSMLHRFLPSRRLGGFDDLVLPQDGLPLFDGPVRKEEGPPLQDALRQVQLLDGLPYSRRDVVEARRSPEEAVHRLIPQVRLGRVDVVVALLVEGPAEQEGVVVSEVAEKFVALADDALPSRRRPRPPRRPGGESRGLRRDLLLD
mmetsp:Transcript_23511/g.75441  ORF Transcript_23511/g.75441 Transcript_23511/m.75441 type:complete len:443 (+) Transcript_23511:1093-2421(+)